MLETLIDSQVRILEMVAVGKGLEDILTACLNFCESQSPDLLTSILIYDPEKRCLRHGAGPSLPPAYMRLVDGLEIGPEAGSCGTAAFRRKPVIVEDIAVDPLWRRYRQYALHFGLRACWSTPILNAQGQVLGTFAIYYRNPRRPNPEHVKLIEIVTHIAGIAIGCSRAEAEKRKIFERISEAFIALDPSGRYTYVNAQAGEWFQRQPDRLLGTCIWDDLPEVLDDAFRAVCAEAMADQKRRDFETFSQPFQKWFETRVFPSSDGLSIYFTDVSNRRQAEEKLRQSEKLAAIGQLSAGVAHDFNNQLSIIQGYAGLLEERCLAPELKSFAAAILRASERSSFLTRNLLAFSRQGQTESIAVDFHELIEEVIGLLGHSVDKKISILKNLRAESAVLLGDPAGLQNSLLNLALNARDAMPDGGTLYFTTDVVALSEAHLHVSVTDTGMGMSAAVKSRIFEPYFTTKPIGKGTGLGLASVFGTIKAHQGSIEVDSAPGVGTTFHLYLPLTTPKNRPQRAESFPTVGALRILAIDDEPPLLEVLAEMLRPGGHRMLSASNGEEGLSLYRKSWQEIDLVILDIVMADMDGYQTARELRRINPEVKIIVSTGYAPESSLTGWAELNPAGVLHKPYAKPQLEKALGEAMA